MKFHKAGWPPLSLGELEALSQLDLDGRTVKNAVHVLKLWLGSAGEGAVVGSSLITDLKKVLELAAGTLVEGQKKGF